MADYDWKPKTEKQPMTSAAVERLDEAKGKLLSKVRGSVYGILLAAIVTLEVLRHFVIYGFNADFAWNIVFSALLDGMSVLFAFYLFFPVGISRRCRTPEHANAIARAEAAAGNIRESGRIGAFRDWCRKKNEAVAREIFEAEISRLEDLFVPRAEFLSKWRVASRRELRAAVRAREISVAAKRQILKCRKPVNVRPFVPAYFLTPAQRSYRSVYLHRESRYGAVSLAVHPVFPLAFALVRNLFVISRAEIEDVMPVLVAIAISVFQICFSSFVGHLSGWRSAQRGEDVMLTKAGFMEEFLEGAMYEVTGSDRAGG